MNLGNNYLLNVAKNNLDEPSFKADALATILAIGIIVLVWSFL